MSESNYNSRLSYYKRRQKRRKKIIIRRVICLFLIVGAITGIVFGGVRLYKNLKVKNQLNIAENIKMPEWVDVQLIHLHNTARSGKKLKAINNIVIHYVGNPASTAQNNRNYFDNEDTEVSSHFVVGLEGEIIQCIPISEKSAASNWRNADTISIEVCHPDESGKFNDVTYQSVVKLTAWLCNKLKLDENAVIRHHDITGKNCPKYYVENENAWETLKNDVGSKLKEFG